MHRPVERPVIESVEEIPFDARFTASLPADPDSSNQRRQVSGAAFSRVRPTAIPNPQTLAVSSEVAALLGFSGTLTASDEFAAVFGGNRVPYGADPFAMVYGGHQFGNWAGQLGDGRALALGEMIDVHGGHQTLQLKGAGPTPYSRTADGRAVLRSSIREFLCSEAMFHLGVPTTRALSLVSTGAPVIRDMFYDGHPKPEPGAVVCRVAPSFTRFGNFQLPAARGDLELLRQLVAFTIESDFPQIWHNADLATFDERVVAWYAEVLRRSAELVVHWMRVGFVHGVLNTDNMSILGLTIDFGPYGWLEGFDPGWTPNTTDAGMKRYRFGAQPSIVGWNLAQLANALVPLLGRTDELQAALDGFGPLYASLFGDMTAARLGWGRTTDERRAADVALINDLHALLARTETDYLIFMRSLADVPIDPTGDVDDNALLRPLRDAYYAPHELTADTRDATLTWLRAWSRRTVDGGLNDTERRAAIRSSNPRFVLRNWIAQEIIDAAEAGDPSGIDRVLEVLRHPYDDQPGNEHYAQKRPEWARVRAGCSMLSCSS
jgi:serine/tyrosine/threonine adenylyltransferase